MEKNLKKLRQSKWLRCCFVLMSCVMVLISCISPAFAAGLRLDEDGQTKHRSYLFGTLTSSVRFGSYDDMQYSTHMDIGGEIANLPMTGSDYDAADFENYHNYSRDDFLDYSLRTDVTLSRRKREIYVEGTKWAFDRVRYRVFNTGFEWDIDNDVLGDVVPSFYHEYTLHFEPFLVKWDDDFMMNLVTLRLDQSTLVTASATYSFVATDPSGKKKLAVVSCSLKDEILGHSNIQSVNFFGTSLITLTDDAGDRYGVDLNGDYVLISDFKITCTVDPLSSDVSSQAKANNDFELELLSCQYNQAIPPFYYSDPCKSFNEYLMQELEFDNIIYPDYGGGGSSGSDNSVVPNVWSQWLAGVVTGFFDAEIMPDFSFGKLFSIIFAVLIVLIALKVFAG